MSSSGTAYDIAVYQIMLFVSLLIAVTEHAVPGNRLYRSGKGKCLFMVPHC